MAIRQSVQEGVGQTRETSFGDLRISYDERVLTPRAWTAEQSAWASDLLVDLSAGPVLELCCGAGHIGLLALSGSGRDLVQVDINPVACMFARINADRARPRGRVDVRNTTLETAVGPREQFVLVIADPPYLPRMDISAYPEDPVLAVDGGPDGLDLAGACLAVIERHLAPGGQALVQLRDSKQAEAVADRLDRGAYGDLRLVETRAIHDSGIVCRVAANGARPVVAADLST